MRNNSRNLKMDHLKNGITDSTKNHEDSFIRKFNPKLKRLFYEIHFCFIEISKPYYQTQFRYAQFKLQFYDLQVFVFLKFMFLYKLNEIFFIYIM